MVVRQGGRPGEAQTDAGALGKAVAAEGVLEGGSGRGGADEFAQGVPDNTVVHNVFWDRPRLSPPTNMASVHLVDGLS